MTESRDELANLDILRALAVTLVAVSHLFAYMNLRGMGNLGHLGVLLFFVHTSLVLMMSMVRMGGSGLGLYWGFLVRRFFRIYPLSVFVVILFITFHISASWLGAFVALRWKDLLANLFLVQNITQSPSVDCVLWSLPFEVQMYFVLPHIYFKLQARDRWAAIAFWFLGISVSSIEYFFRASTVDHDFLVARYMPCFMVGVVVWDFMNRRDYKPSPRFPSETWLPTLLILSVAYRVLDAIRVYGFDWLHASQVHLRNDHGVWSSWPPFLDLVRDWGFCALIGMCIPFFRQSTNTTINFLSRQVAKYSYGIYVIHIPVYSLIFRKLNLSPSVFSAALAVSATGLCSFLLYHILEEPAIRLSKRLTLTSVSGSVVTMPILSSE